MPPKSYFAQHLMLSRLLRKEEPVTVYHTLETSQYNQLMQNMLAETIHNLTEINIQQETFVDYRDIFSPPKLAVGELDYGKLEEFIQRILNEIPPAALDGIHINPKKRLVFYPLAEHLVLHKEED